MPKPQYLRHFWIAAIILAWSADQLFWGQSAGISFPLWILIAILGLFLPAIMEDRHPVWPSYLLAAATLGLSLTLFLRAEPFTRSLSVLLALCGLGLLAATLLNGNWIYYRFGDHIIAGARLFAAAIVRGSGSRTHPKPEIAMQENLPDAVSTSKKGAGIWVNIRKSFPYMRGLLLAFPVLLVLGSLLAAADPIFGSYMKNLLRFFDLAKLPEYLFRLFYILVFAYIFTGLFLHAALPDTKEKHPDPNQPWNMRFLGPTESFMILGSVLALFAFFICLQFRYLFGGETNIRETGYTYSEYARRGFFELVWVAVLSFGLYLALSTVTRRTNLMVQRVFRILSMLLFTFVLLMLASALQRMLLYETAYGFTRLRTYTHIFIFWLGILLLASIILEGLCTPGRIGLAFFLILFGFSFTFSFLNVDGLIANLNLRRAQAGGDLDSSYLASLSTDAVPVLAQAFLTETDPELRDRIGAALACYWIKGEKGQSYQPDWRGYNISSSQAAHALASLDLSAYLIETPETYPGWTVVLPGTGDICTHQGWE